jgi:hypothetical protein
MEKCVPKVTPTAILCVDDDSRAMMARSLNLSVAGYDVQTAGKGPSDNVSQLPPGLHGIHAGDQERGAVVLTAIAEALVFTSV